MKKKIIWILCLVAAFVLLAPIPATYKDGGTITFTSLTYQFISWHEMNDDYEGGYKTGTEIIWFPYFKSKE